MGLETVYMIKGASLLLAHYIINWNYKITCRDYYIKSYSSVCTIIERLKKRILYESRADLTLLPGIPTARDFKKRPYLYEIVDKFKFNYYTCAIK